MENIPETNINSAFEYKWPYSSSSSNSCANLRCESDANFFTLLQVGASDTLSALYRIFAEFIEIILQRDLKLVGSKSETKSIILKQTALFIIGFNIGYSVVSIKKNDDF